MAGNGALDARDRGAMLTRLAECPADDQKGTGSCM